MRAVDLARATLGILSEELAPELKKVLGLRVAAIVDVEDYSPPILAMLAPVSTCQSIDALRMLVRTSLRYNPEYILAEDEDFLDLAGRGFGTPESYALFSGLAVIAGGFSETAMIHCASYEDAQRSCWVEFPCPDTDESRGRAALGFTEGNLDIFAERDRRHHGGLRNDISCLPLSHDLKQIEGWIARLRG